MAEETQTALVLSAGAPNSPLMAGALCAMYKEGVAFDVIYTTGGSALIGLLLVAPKGKAPDEALRGIVEGMGVHDAIYTMVPLGYKTFYKPGPFTRPFHRWAQLFKIGEFPLGPIPGASNKRRDALGGLYNFWADALLKARGGSYARLYNDWIDFCVALMTPTTLNYFSQGMCAPFPFLDDMVDFHKLKLYPGKFFMNAYNMTDHKMKEFGKLEITPAHFRAALSYPSMYPPAEIDGKLYSEGADKDPINFGNMVDPKREDGKDEDFKDVKSIVLIDILGSLEPFLVREPTNLLDAYGISIMTPVVALAQKNLEHFEEHENKQRDKDGNVLKDEIGRDKPIFDLLKMQFTIPEQLQPHVMEWSYSNLSRLWDIGYVTGMDFVRSHKDKLKPPQIAGVKPPSGAPKRGE